MKMGVTAKIRAFLIGGAALLVLAAPIVIRAGVSAKVSGSFAYQDGKPANDRQLHFQNRASNDMFVAATLNDGTFSTYLPPGIYDLRAERGIVLKSKIIVGSNDFDIGRVLEPAPLDVRRPFEQQGVAEAIVQSPAPATANMKGRAVASLTMGHTLVQLLYGPAKPLPPIANPTPAIAPVPEASPAAAASPAPGLPM
ncbi:MAG: hypothetical protein ACLQDV_12450 [Candidatus Binataceae bacterium]